ncbi:prenyltransferase/squalene oxidase repeat-containing protein [Streptomyces sp. NPDC055239]
MRGFLLMRFECSLGIMKPNASTSAAPPLHRRATDALHQAVELACNTQQTDGSWSSLADARIFDHATVMLLLAHSSAPVPTGHLQRGREALGRLRCQGHDPWIAGTEWWLMQLATQPFSPTPQPFVPGLSVPPGRALLMHLLAVIAGVPQAHPHTLATQVRCAWAAASGKPLKQWQRVLLSAAEIVAAVRAGQDPAPEPVQVLTREQWQDGSFTPMPVITAVAHLALSMTPQGQDQARRALSHLLDVQEPDGTWRFPRLEIWATSLMVRSLRGHRLFDQSALPQALRFLEASQAADGGWGVVREMESDADTTSAVLAALAGSSGLTPALKRAEAWSVRARRKDGLWTTWQSSDDHTLAQDVNAHMISGLRDQGAAVDTGPTRDWLAQRSRDDGGWSASWYVTKSYAVNEIGAALGAAHSATRTETASLVEQQHDDGGWPALPGGSSSAAATGLAISALTRMGTPAHERAALQGLAYLVQTQRSDGTWEGTPFMTGPRPFLAHYPTDTLALAAQGLRDALVAHRSFPWDG